MRRRGPGRRTWRRRFTFSVRSRPSQSPAPSPCPCSLSACEPRPPPPYGRDAMSPTLRNLSCLARSSRMELGRAAQLPFHGLDAPASSSRPPCGRSARARTRSPRGIGRVRPSPLTRLAGLRAGGSAARCPVRITQVQKDVVFRN